MSTNLMSLVQMFPETESSCSKSTLEFLALIGVAAFLNLERLMTLFVLKFTFAL